MNTAVSLHERGVVITGASSGIGLATALAFARRGASVALAARRTEALRRACEACQRAGGRAIAVTADVTREGDLRKVATAAIETFGGIDVWINNAGVGLFGPFTNAGLDAHRRVVETNLFGAMHGAAAVLPHFLEKGRGVLITNISIGGFVPVPFSAAYTVSKFALRGFMASLRQEFARSPGLRFCSVFPATVDTPGFAHGANVSGRKLSPSWPLLKPETVANVMVSVALQPRDEVSIGWPTRLAKLGYAAAPLITERVTGAVLRRYVRRGEPEAETLGNLFSPVLAGTGTSGGWRRRPPARNSRRAIASGLVAGGAALLAIAMVRHYKRDSQPS